MGVAKFRRSPSQGWRSGGMARHCVPLDVSENRTAKRLAKGLAALDYVRPALVHRDARRDSGLFIEADRPREYWEACYERKKKRKVLQGFSIGAGLQCICLWLCSRRLFLPLPPPLKKKGNREKKMTARLRRMNNGES